MTRIVAGRAGGRRLAVPQSGTRPTSDRVREAVFASLETTLTLDGLAVLDLFAGSGALGLEALSRGAGRAVLVDRAPAAAAVLRRNVAALGLPGVVVWQRDVLRMAARPAPEAFDLVFLDPPYELPGADILAVLKGLAAGGWLAPSACLVLERSSREAATVWPPGFETTWFREFGDTRVERSVWYGRVSDMHGRG